MAPEANDGLLANFASALVRPDGYLAHVQVGVSTWQIEGDARLPAHIS